MSTPQDPQSGSPQAASSAHQAAASAAAEHLEAVSRVLRAAYDHPHFGDRLTMICSHLASLAAVIQHLPGEEASRADHEARVLKLYRERRLDQVIPEHDDRALRWALERTGS